MSYACCVMRHRFTSDSPLPVNFPYHGSSMLVLGSRGGRYTVGRRNRLYIHNSSLTLKCCGGSRHATSTFVRGPLGSTCPRVVCYAKSVMCGGRRKRVVCMNHGSFRVGRDNCHVRLNRVRGTMLNARVISDYYIMCSFGGGRVILFCRSRRSLGLNRFHGSVLGFVPHCVVPAIGGHIRSVRVGTGNGVSEGCCATLLGKWRAVLGSSFGVVGVRLMRSCRRLGSFVSRVHSLHGKFVSGLFLRFRGRGL